MSEMSDAPYRLAGVVVVLLLTWPFASTVRRTISRMITSKRTPREAT